MNESARRLADSAVQAAEAGRTAEAVEMLAQCLSQAGQDSVALARAGHLLWRLDQRQAALAVLGQALSLPVVEAEAQMLAAAIYGQAGLSDQAETIYRNLLAINPAQAGLWFSLGLLLRGRDRLEEAEEAYSRAVELEAGDIRPLTNRGILRHRLGRLAAAEADFRAALALSPGHPVVLVNLGAVLQAQNRLDEAEAAFRAALAAQPDFAEAHYNLALLLLLLGRTSEAWPHHEWRWQAPGFPSDRRDFRQPLWDGRAMKGRTLLIHCEQGLGDSLHFIRYAPRAAERGAKVLVECPAPLVRLFSGLKGIDRVVAKGSPLPLFHAHCPLMSLPALLDPDFVDIPPAPYLSASPASWIAGQGVKVGLVWAGSPHHLNDRGRSLAPADLAPLLAMPGMSFFSLQVGPQAGAVTGITDLAPRLTDFAETASAVAALDLVITVDTSVAHLAGALGKTVWVLVPFAPDWRWGLHGVRTKWYGSMRLFRQDSPEGWGDVVAAVIQALSGL